MNNGLSELREWFPWPGEFPGYPVRINGWLTGEMKQTITRQLSQPMTIIVEIGSWLGKSAQFILDAAPYATLICIDTWLGSPGQLDRPEWRRLWPTLHERFLSNLWAYRERVVPVRTTSSVGLRALEYVGVHPDLFYIDGSHEAVDVQRDIELAAAVNPAAPIVGDDWTWPSVRQGVRSAMKRADNKRTLLHTETTWTIS